MVETLALGRVYKLIAGMVVHSGLPLVQRLAGLLGGMFHLGPLGYLRTDCQMERLLELQ